MSKIDYLVGSLDSIPDNTPSLGSFYLYLTTTCNLFCKHCWITPANLEAQISESDYIAKDNLLGAIKEAKPLGLSHIKLTGGEPLLHPNFLEIVDLIKSEGLSADMETNGTLITPQIANHLKEKSSVEFISVSLDSHIPDVHDRFRGRKGAFAQAVTGIKNLVDVHYQPQIIMSVYKGNVTHIENVVKLAVSLGAGSVKFNPVLASGRGRSMQEHGEVFSYDEILNLVDYINHSLQRQTPIPLIIKIPPAMMKINDFYSGYFCGCRAANIIGVLGSGEYAICGIGRNVPELCLGSVGKDSLREIWLSHPLLKDLRKDLAGNYPGICGDCIHSGACLTTCIAQNYLDFGVLVHPSSICFQADRDGRFPVTRKRSWKQS